MAFETDIFTNCEGLFICMASWANSVTYGAFWTIILLGFIIVLFMATFNFGVNRSFGYSAIAGAFGSMMLLQMGLIDIWIASAFMVAGVFGIIAMVVGER